MAHLLVALAFAVAVSAQQIGSDTAVNPTLITQQCTMSGGCTNHNTMVVLDALSHPITDIQTGASCMTSSGGFDPTICPDINACGANCAIQGVDYSQHGVTTSGHSLILRQYLRTGNTTTAVSPRVYLLQSNGQKYKLLKLLNQEFTFTVNVSNLPCGMNGALYLSAMDATGGRSSLNPAGATYGTGYCDAQCPKSAWINGEANERNQGACCSEMDIWEANSAATQMTPHACNVTGLYKCSGTDCGFNGVCDENGCGYNPYAYGAKNFYGPSRANTVDTTKPLTVVTQFWTDDNTTTGTLSEIRRIYVQNNVIIQNALVYYGPGEQANSITPSFCNASAPGFEARGGLAQMGGALYEGMVLVMSIWNDPGAYMNWLDSGNAGPCNSTQGNPALIEAQDPGTSVTFSAIKIGDIGSTVKGFVV
ncbi:glycoside hydrolase family 7 protein [Baudoinia panamericana UAMH 10762]|uniref:Glucanase n=1 Tax=Baudoinia panamericana (strain UAMH 10762) TaxID=717646 RepID=M2NFH1_BAUPA|nr:glycoside hydrolase family 7 protein [Baudoinia panamericana UAMH 10762]EMC97745.1 glycoside hydrolase family 7 protein [Baudoinia panamericana UAMH 10762]